MDEKKINIVGVVTSPDKPAGRGKKIQQSAVKKYAIDKKLNCPNFNTFTLNLLKYVIL